jgi:bifunctional non-homologous end joining protein LigD
VRKPTAAASNKNRATASTADTRARAATQPPAALNDYAQKRSFAGTPEPAPTGPIERDGPLLFVVQQHAARALHFDLRLELDGVLKSWAVPKGPSMDRADKRLAVPTEDHPLDYASFEGVIPPKQYGAGEVIVWDCGVYSPDEGGVFDFSNRRSAQERVRSELAAGKLSFFLLGEKLKGSFALVRTGRVGDHTLSGRVGDRTLPGRVGDHTVSGRAGGPSPTGDGKSWLLIKHKDARWHGSVPEQHARSVLSGMTPSMLRTQPAPARVALQELVVHGPREAMPQKLAPMLAGTAEAPFSSPEWSFEPKLDGYRVLAFVDHGNVRLRSRTGQDYTAAFPEIVAALQEQVPDSMLLDGELVAFENAGASFNALQNRAQLKLKHEIDAAQRATPCALYCFDLLHFAGCNLRALPYRLRRRYLIQCLLENKFIKHIHADTNGSAMYQAALQTGLEGVVAKKLSSVYEAGRRSANWLKVKTQQSAEFVIGGYSEGSGHRKASLGALLLGYWNTAGKLIFVGNVGTGFDGSMLGDLKKRLEALSIKRCPFAERPAQDMPTTWVKPELVAEVKFSEFTPSQQLRAPVFLRVRDDVAAAQIAAPQPRPHGAHNAAAQLQQLISVVLQQLENERNELTLNIGAHEVRVTNLNKALWPARKRPKHAAFTKRDLLRYLARIAPHMLPHLADRALTVIRMPDGIEGERFFQKHWDNVKLPDFVASVAVYSETKDVDHQYIVCNNLPTLLWLGQSGALEFHVWHSRINPLPDRQGASVKFTGSSADIDASILNFPDYLVFDIDPYVYSGKEGKGEEPEFNRPAFDKGRQVALHLNELLTAMKLRSVVKTSGKTGLHIFVPILRTLDFDATRRVSEMISRHLQQRFPKDVTIDWSIEKRTGKIFIDYNMNARTRTLNSAYSPRGLPGAPVSMPLTWEELEVAYPTDFTIENVFERLAQRPDVWRDVINQKQDLKAILGSS